jgi:hypothetical protein
MRMKGVFTISVLFLAAAAVGAQTAKWGMGPHLVISLPQQGFDNLSKDGEGMGGKLYYRFNPYFALRSDLAYISYGERRESEMIDYGSILVTRRNESFQLTVGPQLTWRIGRITPYAAALGGLYFYHTVITVDSYYSYYPYTESKGSQTKWGWNLGTGLLIDLGIGPHIDLGFKYQNISDVETEHDEKTVKMTGIDYCITLGVVFFRD